MFLTRSIAALVLAVTLHAQQQPLDEEAARRADEAARLADQQRQAAEQQRRRELEESNRRMQDFLTDSRETIAANVRYSEQQRERLRRAQAEQFNRALLSLETSRHQLEEALGFKSSLKEPGKSMEKNVGALLGFVKGLHKNRAQLDAAQFKGFTSVELGWEALRTAERVSPQLMGVVNSQNTEQVDIRFLQSLTKLEGDLLRLQWITRHLQ